MNLIIGLSVVIVAFDGQKPRVLATRRDDGVTALPFGAFDPNQHRTFELALRGLSASDISPSPQKPNVCQMLLRRAGAAGIDTFPGKTGAAGHRPSSMT